MVIKRNEYDKDSMIKSELIDEEVRTGLLNGTARAYLVVLGEGQFILLNGGKAINRTT